MAPGKLNYTKEEKEQLGQIIPEYEQALKERGPVPPLDRDSITRRAIFKEMMISKFGKASDDTAIQTRDFSVKARDGYNIPVRSYAPVDASQGLPLIIAMHPGGWCLGELEMAEPVCVNFVKNIEGGAVCLNIDYRQAPETKWPKAVEDCWEVVKWCADSAQAELHVDLTRGFILWGSSSGANLASVVAHIARDQALQPPLTGLFEVSGAYIHPDFVPEKYKDMYQSMPAQKDRSLNHEDFMFFLEQYAPEPTSGLFSPIYHPKGHQGLPPVYFQVPGMCNLRDDALIYEKALREEGGVKTKLDVYAGVGHGFSMGFPKMKISQQANEDAMNGMKWLLGRAE